MFNFSKALCHAGTFHSDDVFSGAFLKILNPQIKIERSNIVPENFDGIVFDIGNGEFDHHSIPRERRKNGIPYSSFGKLWRKFAPIYFSAFVVQYIDEVLCSKIDLSDNTGEDNMLVETISIFNPFWTESLDDSNEKYLEMVNLAEKILKRYIEKAKAEEIAIGKVEEVIKKSRYKNILVLDSYIPWKQYLFLHADLEIKVVVFPSNRGGFCAQVVPNSNFEFPKSWWGTISVKDSIVPGMSFCHATGFLAVFDTQQNAINAIQKILQGKTL